MTYKLRDYQEKAIDNCIKELSSKKICKSVAILPVGAGKSIIISEICRQLTDGNIIVGNPSKELLLQGYGKFTTSGGEAEIFSASLNTKNIGKVTFATTASLKTEYFKDKNIKYLLLDECHLNTQEGSKLNKFIKELGITKILGFTASPIYLKTGADGSCLKMINRVKGKLFNHICHLTEISELVNKNFWSPIIYDVVKQDNKPLVYNSTGSDFDKNSLKSYYEINGIENKILEKVNFYKDRKSILIFMSSVEEAKQLSLKIKDSEVVFSGMGNKERDKVVEGFKTSKIRVVLNVNILATGFDFPQLDCVILARPTASIALFYQQIGRVIRIHEDKKDALVIDLSGNVEKFSKIENLSFKNIENFGWGMFNEKYLLSGVPLWEHDRPTLDSLKDNNGKITKEVQPKTPYKEFKIWFGKYKDKNCEYLVNKQTKYVTWMLSNKEWDWSSERMSSLKISLLVLMREKFPNDERM